MSTLLQLRQAALGGYALPETGADDFLTDPQWTRYLNRSYRWLARHARLISGKWTSISTVNGTQEYSIAGLSPGLAGIDFVLFKQGGTNGSWAKLTRLPVEQVVNIATSYHDTTGSPTHFYTRGSDKLGLYPIPDATNAGAFLEIWGWAYPTALSADGDTPTIDSNLHEYLLPGAWYEAAKQEQARGRSDAAALVLRYEAERRDALNELRAYLSDLGAGPSFCDWSMEEM